jgi:hypothetical protein
MGAALGKLLATESSSDDTSRLELHGSSANVSSAAHSGFRRTFMSLHRRPAAGFRSWYSGNLRAWLISASSGLNNCLEIEPKRLGLRKGSSDVGLQEMFLKRSVSFGRPLTAWVGNSFNSKQTFSLSCCKNEGRNQSYCNCYEWPCALLPTLKFY